MYKLALLVITFACFTCVFSTRYSRTFEVEKGRSQCIKSCVKFADYVLKNEKIAKGPYQQAKEFCMHTNLQVIGIDCNQVLKFSRLVHIYVKSGIPKHRICRHGKICPRKRNPARGHKVPSRRQSTVLCKACRSMVYAVSVGVKVFNYTEQKMKSTIQFLCNVLSPLKVQSKLCKVILDEIDSVFQMILKGVKPGKICTKLGLCTNSTASEAMEILTDEFMKLLSSNSEMFPYYMKRAMVLKNSLPMALEKYEKWSKTKADNLQRSVKRLGNGTICKLCMTITNMIKEDIKFANATIEAIEEAIRLFCDLQFGPVKKVCLSFLSKIDAIVQYIEKGLSPGEICVKLGFCTKNEEEMATLAPAKELTSETPPTSSCQVCDAVSNIVGKETKDFRSTTGKMREYLADVCKNSQMFDVQSKCLSAAPMLVVIDGMADQIFHQSICRKVICSRAFGIASSIFQNGKKTPCDICHNTVKMFAAKFKYLEKLVEKALDEVNTICGYIVYKEVANQCHLYVNKTRAMFRAIVKKLDPTAICAALKICPKQVQEFSLYEEFLKIATSGSAPTCSICKIAIESVQEETNAQMVRKTLEDTCQGISLFSGKKVCTKLLGHLDDITGFKSEKKTPKKVCTELKLCEKEVPVMKMLGGIVDGLKDLFSDW